MTFLSVSDLGVFDCLFALLMLFFLRTTVVAGGGPAAAHFLCFAKESKQRKATAIRRPAARGTRWRRTQIGKGNKLATLRQVSLLYPI